jgi:hypothetical protein
MAPLTGLTLGTTYYYRVVATSAAGIVLGPILSLMTATPVPSGNTGSGSGSSVQRLSLADKQSFLNLATAYGQRATRLTAIAQATGAPLNKPLFQLAAYYFAESLTYAAIASDPPDPNFTTVAPAQNVTVPPLTAGGGITQAEADQFNALFAEEGQALGLAQALSTALNRAQAASEDPSDATFAQLQVNAVTQFAQQLGTVVDTEPTLLSNVQTALAQSGAPDVSVTPSDVAALQSMVASNGLPDLLVQALQQLQTSAAQLQMIQAQLLQQAPAAAAGSLSATLTDPAFAALVQTNASVLMTTVAQGGVLSPSSDSGTSSSDGITNNTTPLFTGTAPSGTVVELFAQPAGATSAPVLIGQTTADGSGQWQITAAHLSDGTYAISASFAAGSNGAAQVVPLGQVVIDTVGPRVTAATYNKKTGQVTLSFSDPMGLDMATLANLSFFVARSSKTSPPLTISRFQQAGTLVTFTVSKGRKHPTTIYLDVVSGGIRDAVGNALDGVFTGTFPSGSGHAGGDFFSQLPVPKPKPKAKKPGKAGHKFKA